MTDIITAQGLSKTYKTVTDEVMVFENIDVAIAKGSTVAIIGQSGRGKTTLLNILSGLDRPTGGAVYFEGSRFDNLDEQELSVFRNRNVGFIFQHHYLLDDFTALENILLPLRIGGAVIDSEARDRALALLESVGLHGRETHYPDQLSGGERQRVAIVRALIHGPEVIFADEPTGSLDRHNAGMVEDMIWKLKDEHRKTFIMATHNLEMARRCDRIIDMG